MLTEGGLSQAHFQCVACGHMDHADINAAKNILRRGLTLSNSGRCRLPVEAR